jgi:hypothetical protein
MNSNANIPFLRTKLNYAVAATVLFAVAAFIYTLINHGFSWLMLGLLLPLPVVALDAWQAGKQCLLVLERIEEVLRHTNQGQLYHRVTKTRGMGEAKSR